MHWTDEAIILSIKKHGENSAVARLFTHEHGVFGGVVRGVHSKASRGLYQPGNIVIATWQARLSEHLGSFKAELMEAHAAFIMQEAAKLSALTSACAVLEAALPERHPYTKLYRIFRDFLAILKTEDDWQEDYIRFELALLAESGFGLDLEHCAATGSTKDLIYVSPKSGRAVSREAGEPYKNRLLPLPAFLLRKALPLEGGGLGGGDRPATTNALPDKARSLRSNMTDAEKKLWQLLSRKQLEGHRFRRQHPIGGRYIVDFICLEQKLIIELDGGQHAEQQEYDKKRTLFLEKEGYRVLRFWNNEVMENIEAVWDRIMQALTTPTADSLSPPPNPPPSRGRAFYTAEILAGMELTGYFLEHWLLEPHNRKLPAARGRLVEYYRKTVSELA